MNNNKEESSKKIGLKFAAMMIGSVILGVFSGMGAAIISDLNPDISIISRAVTILVFALLLLSSAAAFIISLAIYIGSKREYACIDEDDDEAFERIEKKLNYPIIISSGEQILTMGLFPTIVWLLDNYPIGREMDAGISIVTLVTFLVTLVWVVTLQNAVVKMVKRMNPEKKGSVFETDFRKKWLDSCDEGQRLSVYKSAYKAYSVTLIVCMGLWVISLLMMFAFNTGVTATIFVSLIMLVMMLTYSIACLKNENKNSR